jgi:ribosomal protein S18 acetylase RimI-like enzyme
MDGTLAPLRATATGTMAQSHLAQDSVPSGRYRVRTAEPADAALIRDFVCGLSVRTQYFRFFTAVAPPGAGLLRALTGENGRADILLVTDPSGAVVGHGMAADGQADGRHTADIGLVIADRWQGQGLGTMLLRLLTERAARRGVEMLVLEVLPDNRRMLGIIERRWPHASRQRTPDAITITAELVLPDLDWPALPGRLLAAQLIDCATRGAGHGAASHGAANDGAAGCGAAGYEGAR